MSSANRENDIEEGIAHQSVSSTSGQTNSTYYNEGISSANRESTSSEIRAFSSNTLVVIDDDDEAGPPLPSSMLELPNVMTPPLPPAQIAALCEQIVDDNEGTDEKLVKKLEADNTAMVEESRLRREKMSNNPDTQLSLSIRGVDANDDGDCPAPLSFRQFDSVDDDDDDDMLMREKYMALNGSSTTISSKKTNLESILYAPPREEFENEEECINDSAEDTNHRRGWEDIEEQLQEQQLREQIDNDYIPKEEDEMGGGDILNEDDNMTIQADVRIRPTTIEHAGSTPIIPEAFLVEEGEQNVIIAEHLDPTLPWWKQRRTKMLLVVLLIVTVGLGVMGGLLSSWGGGSTNNMGSSLKVRLYQS